MKKRCEWKDCTSAIVIFLIYVEHISDLHDTILIRDFVKLYANPIFFMLGGFFAGIHSYSFKEYCIRNVKRLLIPYWGWVVTNIVFYTLFYNITEMREGYLSILQYLTLDVTKFQYGGSLWYLVGLFVCKILYEVLRYIFRNKWVIFVVCLGITIVLTILLDRGYPILDYAYTRGIYWMVFYSLGPILYPVFDKIHENVLKRWNGKRKELVAYCVCMASLCFFAAYIYWYGIEDILNLFSDYVQTFIKEIIIPMGLVVFTIVLTWYIRHPVLVKIGQNTIILCALETMVKHFIPMLFAILGMPFTMTNDITRILFVMGCFVLIYKFVFPFIDKYMPWLVGKF